MSSKKPEPLVSGRKHDRCPVCGEVSYSRAGVHPQCAVRQADEKRITQLKRERIELAEAVAENSMQKPASSPKPWQRLCPNCKTVGHVRQKSCTCGFTFGAVARLAVSGVSTR